MFKDRAFKSKKLIGMFITAFVISTSVSWAGNDLFKNLADELLKTIEEEFKDENIIHLGDPIIQIGTVFYDYSKGETFRHILVIGNKEGLITNDICDDLEGITVEKCDSEKDLLLGWRNIIKEMDPDFITGYNIFGFDFDYIGQRANKFFKCIDRVFKWISN